MDFRDRIRSSLLDASLVLLPRQTPFALFLYKSAQCDVETLKEPAVPGRHCIRLKRSLHPAEGNDQFFLVIIFLGGTHHITATEVVAEFSLFFLFRVN